MLVAAHVFWLALPGLGPWWARIAYTAVGVVIGGVAARSWRLLLTLGLPFVIIPVVGAGGIGVWRYLDLDVASHPRSDWNRLIGAERDPLLLHVSDTHFIGATCGRTYEKSTWTVKPLRDLAALTIRLRPRFLVISGDVTDTGSEAEWQQARDELLNQATKAGARILLAPGTHDLQPAFGGWATDSTQAQRFLAVASSVDPGLRTVDGAPLTTLIDQRPSPDEVSRHRLQLIFDCNLGCRANDRPIRSCLDSCMRSTTTEVAEKSLRRLGEIAACQNWFPFVLDDPEARVRFIVTCSAGVARETIGGAAVGGFGPPQLARLKTALTSVPPATTHIFTVMHHPPVRRAGDRLGFPEKWTYTALANSPWWHYTFLSSAVGEARTLVHLHREAADARPTAQFTILHGHRHQDFLGKIDADTPSGAWVWIGETSAAYEREGGAWFAFRPAATGPIEWRRWAAAPSVDSSGCPGSTSSSR